MLAQQPIVIKTGGGRRGGYKRKRGKTISWKAYNRMRRTIKRQRYARNEMVRAMGGRGTEKNIGMWGETWSKATPAQQMLRRAYGYKGKGDYGWQGAALRGLGETAGSFFGYGNIGRSLGGRVSKYLGYGDYGGPPVTNQLMAGSGDAPITVNASDDLTGDVYISHREFVGNVQALVPSSGLSVFNVNTYALNVGLSATFPWLSQIANCFTLYELHGLIFEYRPTSGELGSTSNQLGKIIMATNYDPDSSSFTSSVQMENYDYANSCKPSQGMTHGVETAKRQSATNMLYIRAGPSSKSKIFTDIGNFQVATEGIPVAGTAGSYQTIGELWVTYRVKLSRALLQQSLGGANLDDYFYGSFNSTVCDNTTTAINGSAALSAAYNLPPNNTTFAAKKTNNLGCTVTSSATTNCVLTFPTNIIQGAFRVTQWVHSVSATTSSYSAPTSATNCSVVASNANAGNFYAPTIGVASDYKMQSFIVSINAPGLNQASIQLNWTSTLVASGGYCNVWVELINPQCYTAIA